MGKKRTPMTLSFEQDTKDRLRAYADENRMSVSQAITQWIWATPLREEVNQKKNDDTQR